ncbi:MAG: stage II sporulation protein R [Bacillota bacterium]
MRKTKLLVVGVLVAGAVAAGGAAVHWQQEAALPAYNQDNLIRIHIVPHSDDEADQVLKHRVRQAVVENVRPLVFGVHDAREAGQVIGDSLVMIQQVSQAEVEKAGKHYPVEVGYGTFAFPTRTYGSLTLAAGDYQAVRVTLGSGGGANWWCVLFPPLCFVDAEPQALGAGTADGVPAAGSGRLQVKFRAAELWERSAAIAANLAGHLNGKDKEERI